MVASPRIMRFLISSLLRRAAALWVRDRAITIWLAMERGGISCGVNGAHGIAMRKRRHRAFCRQNIIFVRGRRRCAHV